LNSSPTTHAKPCTAGFYPCPAMQICVKRATSPRGGTLASANSPSGGHSYSCLAARRFATQRNATLLLFLQAAHKIIRNCTNLNEAAVVRPAASGRARRPNRRYLPAAKSRPSPFPVVDYIAHSLVSSVPLGRTCETKRRTFSCAQKGFARS